MYKYQNVSETDQTITANGNINPRIVKSGGMVVSDVPLENPNFQYVGEEANAVKAAIDQPQSGAVTNAQLSETNKEIK